MRGARIAAVLVLGAISAWLMGDFLSIVNLVLTVNLPFGAAVLTIYFWRRLTSAAVWTSVVLSTLVILVVPWTAARSETLRTHPSLVQTAPGLGGRPEGVYFASVIRQRPDDLTSPLVGSGRFNFEGWLLNKVGLAAASQTRNQRLTAQFFFDGLFPFAVLLVVSLFTRQTDSVRVAPLLWKNENSGRARRLS